MNFLFPLSVQTVLPENFYEDALFREQLSTLKKAGYTGVELNIADPSKTNVDQVLDFLKEFELTLTAFASGLTAKMFNLSLSHTDESIRTLSVDKVKEIIDFLGDSGVGIILGFFKGPKAEDEEAAHAQFVRSMKELVPYAGVHEIPLIVEATNRYESAVCRSLDETVETINMFESEFVSILPDTFHMNIEEADMLGSLSKHKNLFSSIHLSDNNRFFPGYGAIDFQKILRHLKEIEYTGRTALEGKVKNSFQEDCMYSAKYLSELYAGI